MNIAGQAQVATLEPPSGSPRTGEVGSEASP